MIKNIYREMLNNMFEGIYYVDTKRQIEFWNKAAEVITGYKARDILGNFCHNNILNHVDIDGNQLCLNGCPLQATIEDGEFREANVFLHHKEGHRVPVSVKTFPIYDEDKIIGAMEIFVDTSRKKSELFEDNEIHEEYLDEVTGLANRVYLKSMLNMSQTNYITTNIPYAVVIIGIDNIDELVSQHGESTKNDLLRVIAKSLYSGLRNEDFVARWSKDEFMIILKGVNQFSLEKLVNRSHTLSKTSTIRNEGEIVNFTVSLGAAIIHPTDTVDSLIERVYELYNWSKCNGGDRVTF